MDRIEPATTPTIEWVVHTFGCKVNTYDSGLLEKRLQSEGANVSGGQRFDLKSSQAQSGALRVHLVNSCAVTQEATREALRLARKIKSRDEAGLVVLTGCSAQVDGAIVDSATGVDLVVANSHKGEIEKLVREHLQTRSGERVFRSNIFKKDDLEMGGGEEQQHSRAFLKIQDGCNSFCTFCVIPFARGKSRSIDAAEICRRVDELHAKGYQEVVLTGVHIGDYECEASHANLTKLVEKVLTETKIPRLRLTSLEPIELTSGLLDCFQDSRMCSHFHMSIQSASSKVLQLMKRKYSAEEVETALQLIDQKVPGAFVGMDVIVGFPGEGEEEFLETYSRLSDLPWTKIHVFPYSERPGTFAMKLSEVVDMSTRARRADRLRELSRLRWQSRAQRQVGSQKIGLPLHSKTGARFLTRDYWTVKSWTVKSWPVKWPAENVSTQMGSEVLLEITGVEDEFLLGQPVADFYGALSAN